jgi:acyl dehydratase
LGAASHHGRILVLNSECAKESTGHGSPLPLLVHGGPGRAGGGEEMGGLRGVKHYMQRTAIQGSPTMITAISNVYQTHAKGNVDGIHPFKKYFEELKIGDQIVTEKRLITSEDISKFADLSGDHFYAHMIDTDFTGTMFEEQVAHGYFIMSASAGLFVDSYDRNPVLLNYGIDELRFTKPMYAGASLYIRFTCKEKIAQELKEVNPDVISCHSSTDHWLAALARLTLNKKPAIVRTRHISTPVHRNISSNWLYNKGCESIMTTSESIKNDLTQDKFVRTPAVSVPTGIDTEIFVPGNKIQQRKSINLPQKHFIFGIAATLRSWKGHSDLIQAFNLLENPMCTLIIIGDGPQMENCKKLEINRLNRCLCLILLSQKKF